MVSNYYSAENYFSPGERAADPVRASPLRARDRCRARRPRAGPWPHQHARPLGVFAPPTAAVHRHRTHTHARPGTGWPGPRGAAAEFRSRPGFGTG